MLQKSFSTIVNFTESKYPSIIIVYLKHTNLEKTLVKKTLYYQLVIKKVNEYMCFYLIKYKLNKIEANIVRLSYH